MRLTLVICLSGMIKLIQGDCLEQMKTLEDNSVDSIVSDPPYGISFMAKKWDYDVPSVEVWKEAMRVLKPGGHALIACGTRTQHRMVCNIEDAGFEIRDVVSWIYGSGFPKSLNIGKAIDKMDASDTQQERRYKFTEWVRSHDVKSRDIDKVTNTKMGSHYTTAASQPAIMTREHLEACRHLFSEVPQWVEDECDKRSVESENFKSRDVVGEKSSGLSGGSGNTVGRFTDSLNENGKVDITTPATEAAKQWDGWGTALKPACEFFTLCRKPLSEKTVAANVLKWGTGGINVDGCRVGTESTGRFPANLIHDGSEEVLGLFPETGDKSPARFFYCPKASKTDRNEGCESLDDKFRACLAGSDRETNGILDDVSERFRTKPAKNNHPTVKPTALMAYLCRLITPPGGVVLDPYMGSGSTGKAAIKEGFGFVGVELDPGYHEIAKSRVVVS